MNTMIDTDPMNERVVQDAPEEHDLLRPSIGGDALLLSVLVISFAAVAVLIAWGLSDARREGRAQLVIDTARPQVLPITAGRLSLTSAEEFAAYYPAQLKAHPGDTVRFTNPTIEDPHSVTFGLEVSRSNQPAFADGNDLSHINGPCVSDVALSTARIECGETDLPPFAGQPFYNSGIIAPGGGTFDLRLSTALAAGTYNFFCVIHPGQTGAIEVVAREVPTQRPRTLIRAADEQFERDSREMRRFLRDADAGRLDAPAPTIRAGAATARVSLNRFLPSEVTINSGESVTWANNGSVPHVMTFGGALPAPVAAETPPTRPSGSSITDGLFTTGPIGAWPYPRTEYTLRFDRRGRYEYACWLHPGMTGSVVVR
jgi:plastocyanin